MKKLLILLILGLLSLQAVEVKWIYSYDKALAKAKKEKKNILLVVTTERCGWCRKLENETMTDKDVVERLNKDYIVVHATRGVDKYPKYLKVGPVPACFFLNTDEKPIINPVVGYWPVEDFLSYMDDVDYKLGKKQY